MSRLVGILVALTDSWCWRMAWRDSRANRRRFILFLLAISLGVAALVSLQSFGHAVSSSITSQNKALLGADLVLRSRRPLPEEVITKVQQFSKADAREWRFGSMVRFIDNKKAPRLIQVRAVDTLYPLYGEIKTQPIIDPKSLHDGLPVAVVEESILHQYQAQPGDKIRLGQQEFRIIAGLKSIPGESVMTAEMAPRIIIPFNYLEKTGLIGFGSRVRYRHNFLYRENINEKALLSYLKEQESLSSLRFETVTNRQERIDKTMDNLFHFLNMTALIALILGGIGIGSAVHVYIKSKLRQVAILRCLGASINQTFAIYLIQALFLGVAGSITGVAGGLMTQFFLPQILGNFMPVAIENSIAWKAVGTGMLCGTIVTLLFCLVPLLKVRRITPLESLRVGSISTKGRDWAAIFIYLLLALLIIIFSLISAANIKIGLAMAGGLFGALVLLLLCGKIMMTLLRVLLPRFLPFPLRQGLHNLYRPNNLTLILILSLGTGTFLISTLFLSRQNLLYQVEKTAESGNPDMILFDIQYDQALGVRQLLHKSNLPVLQDVPIVSMRLEKINGIDTVEILQKNKELAPENRLPHWALTRDYRCSYRAELLDTERLVPGDQFTGKIDPETAFDKAIPVSVAQRLMKILKLKKGDSLTFNIDGLTIETYVDSRRDVEWMQMRPNFFVIFPAGLLEEAPQMNVMVTKTGNVQKSAEFQNKLNDTYPNVSALDLSLVLKTVNNMLDQAGFAVRFIAAFSLLTGIVILICSLQLSQMQRLRENALLKVIGARRQQIRIMLISEFSFLALLSANAGCALAYTASEIISHRLFESSMPFDSTALVTANALLLSLTIALGLFSCRQLYRRTSLNVLQEENR